MKTQDTLEKVLVELETLWPDVEGIELEQALWEAIVNVTSLKKGLRK